MTGDLTAMPKITFVEADGNRTVSEATPGSSLMETAVAAGVDGIVAECGGACACATCHCHVDESWFAKIAAAEELECDMLEFVINPSATSRLSCQVTITEDMDGMVVSVPESQT